MDIDALEKKLGYTFNNKKHILIALTHCSLVSESRDKLKCQDNEKIEFLGDSILNFLVSEFIYYNFPALSEGQMSKARARVVCEAALAGCAKMLGIGQFLFMGHGTELIGGRMRASILGDAFEAIVGAIFLDGGMGPSRRFVLTVMKQAILDAVKNPAEYDYKTRLQEIVQKSGKKRITYRVISQYGPEHDKTFVVCVSVGGEVVGEGEGKSKKDAQQRAAQIALSRMKI